jgi:hypothetical protein
MIKSRTILFQILLLCSPFFLFGQQKFTISGTIKDAKSGEELIGANVYVKNNPTNGTSTNAYGFYSLTLPQGKYEIAVQYVGYQLFSKELDLVENQKIDFEITSSSQQLKEVEVKAEKDNLNVSSAQMGVTKIDINEIKNIPVIFGERDVLKTISLLPGIKSAGEGNAGFYVRGGGTDQNLILLDEAPVYNASHLLGFFSVFNSDAIKDLTLYKGNMPAEYGGRLSSVVDIRMKEGNMKKYVFTGGIGLIASRLTIEGPIVKDKGSFIISGRRTYADLFLKLSKDEAQRNTKLYFYDLNAKANYRIGPNDRIFLSGYFGRDNFSFNNLFGIDYGNSTATARWNHVFNSKWFSNTTFIYSNYSYKIKLSLGESNIDITSKVQDWNLKEDVQYFYNNRNTFKAGFQSIYHTFVPGVITADDSSGFASQDFPKKYAWENAGYIQHEKEFGSIFKLNYGLRVSSFSLVGPGDFYSFDSDGNITDSTILGSGKFLKTYVNLEPRITGNYMISDNHSIKASYSRNVQNLHLLSNSTVSSPTDRWVPSSNNILPETADQVAVGYFTNFHKNKFEASVELYYKWMGNQVDYKNNAELRGNELVEADLLRGIGRAYGIEFYIKRKVGKLTGWVSYTLSRTERSFDGIDNGKWFAAKQDRTHDLSLVGMWEFHPKWVLSATFVYYTGNAVTFPSGKYEINGQVVEHYTERNGYRMPAYHRLDIGLTWNRKMTEKRESSWNLSIYNVYLRENAFQINFETDPNDPNRTRAMQLSLFKIVPTITYNFKF